MTKQEIDNLINKGEPLEIFFEIRKTTFYIGKEKITEKQFDAARERFEGKLDFKRLSSGFTVHKYTLKDIYL